MAFPVSIKGSIWIHSVPAVRTRSELIVKVITLLLKEEYARSVSIDGRVIRFNASLLEHRLFPAWFHLAWYRGTIKVEEAGTSAGIMVQYHISTLKMLLVSAAMSAVLSIITLVFFGQNTSTAAMLFVFAWFWLFGGNYVATLFLFPRWLERGVRNKMHVSSGAVANA